MCGYDDLPKRQIDGDLRFPFKLSGSAIFFSISYFNTVQSLLLIKSAKAFLLKTFFFKESPYKR